MPIPRLPKQDRELVQIVDKALAETTQKSGAWLVCRSGCTQCCIGVFAISQLDATRLRHGMDALNQTGPARASAVRERARQSIAKLSRDFPGDAMSGALSDDGESQERFAEFGNDEPCPALSPETGECELYAYRPMTCRVFGPPIRSESEEGLGVCELCYHGATSEEIAACELKLDCDELENALIAEVEKTGGVAGSTIVAYCLADKPMS